MPWKLVPPGSPPTPATSTFLDLTTQTHAMCDDCWSRTQQARSGQPPTRTEDRAVQRCCFCGAETRSGMFMRQDPAGLRCGGRHNYFPFLSIRAERERAGLPAIECYRVMSFYGRVLYEGPSHKAALEFERPGSLGTSTYQWVEATTLDDVF